MSRRQQGDRANPNTIPDLLREVGLGQILQQGIPVLRRKISGAVSSNQLATLHQISLGDAPAAVVLRATVRAGGVTGELVPKLYGVTPATGEIAVAPNGDIVVLAADAITDLDILYIPEKVDFVTLDITVAPATGIGLLPGKYTGRGVALLRSANATTGTVTGVKRVLVPGAVNPATPQVRLDVAKTQVQFTVADAVSKATVVVGVAAEKDVFSLMAAVEGTV